MQPVAGSLAGPQAKPSHLLVSWIWQSKVWASLWSPPPAKVVWPLRPLAEVGAPASGAASGLAGSSPAGGPGHGGASLPPPSVYNETVGETVQGQPEREWDGGGGGSHTQPPPRPPLDGGAVIWAPWTRGSPPAPPMGTTAGRAAERRAGGHSPASDVLRGLPL